MSLNIITKPSVEPVTLAEAKLNARIDGTEFDSLIPGLIASARETCEQQLSRALLEQTWELALDAFPDDAIQLNRPRVMSIVSVKYIDTAGVEQTLSSSLYTLDADTLPGYVLPAYGTEWPSTRDGTANAVRVRFTCGYGTTASSVPESVKRWIKVHVALALRQPEAASDRPLSPVPYLDNLLDRERWSWV